MVGSDTLPAATQVALALLLLLAHAAATISLRPLLVPLYSALALCLEVDARSLNEMPAREVLWEQDAWNDLAKSLELNRRYSPLQPTASPYSP